MINMFTIKDMDSSQSLNMYVREMKTSLTIAWPRIILFIEILNLAKKAQTSKIWTSSNLAKQMFAPGL